MTTPLPAKQEVVDTSEDPDVGGNDGGSEPGSARLDATKALYVGSLHSQVNEAMLEVSCVRQRSRPPQAGGCMSSEGLEAAAGLWPGDQLLLHATFRPSAIYADSLAVM